MATLIFVPLTWVTRDIRFIYWSARFGVRLTLWLSGVRVRLIGDIHSHCELPVVFVSNHVSNIEPAVLFMLLPRVAVILKRELARIPLLGYVMKMGGFIYVNRKDRNSRHEALKAAIATLRRKGLSLLVFPEGTRSINGKLLPFNPGPFTIALEAQAPIVPITVHGARKIMPKGSANMKPGEITLVLHEPILTKGFTTNHRAEIMKRVRSVMEKEIRSNSF